MKKKLLSWMLALALTVTVLPTPAFAAAAHTAAAQKNTVSEKGEEGETESGEGGSEEEGKNEGEEEENKNKLLSSATHSATHPTHLSEGTVSLTDLIASDVGTLTFLKGTTSTTGSVKVTSWSVSDSKKLTFKLSGGKDGDTATFPIAIVSEKYGNASLTVTVTLGYDQITITSATTVALGATLKLTCAGITSGDSVIYSITKGSELATIEGDTLTARKGGTVTVVAMKAGEPDAISSPVEITITKGTPTGTPTFTKLDHAGQTLADVTLKADGFSVKGRVEWVLSGSTIVVANTAYEWKFIPEDTDSYNTITGTVTPYPISDSTFAVGEGTTTENSDGSFTTVSFGKDDSTYRLTEYTDGSKCLVHTAADGTITTTEQDANGYRTQTIENADGSKQTTAIDKSGISYTTIADKYGYTTAQIYIPYTVTATAAKTGEVISLPIPEIPCTDDRADAPVLTISLSTSSPVRIGIPINSPTAGTVAITVAKNGAESVVKTSTTGRDCVEVTLSGSAGLKIADLSKSFLDVKRSQWFQSAVDFATSRGLFNGVSATKFDPNGSMSRAMLVTVLHNLEDNPSYGYSGRLSDLDGTWYETAAAWAVSKGYVNGFEDGTFRGDLPITREQLAVILYRYAGYPSVTSYVNQSPEEYSDCASISSYAYSAMYWAVCSGVLYTSGRDRLAPQQSATRAEVAVAFQNLVEFMTH